MFPLQPNEIVAGLMLTLYGASYVFGYTSPIARFQLQRPYFGCPAGYEMDCHSLDIGTVEKSSFWDPLFRGPQFGCPQDYALACTHLDVDENHQPDIPIRRTPKLVCPNGYTLHCTLLDAGPDRNVPHWRHSFEGTPFGCEIGSGLACDPLIDLMPVIEFRSDDDSLPVTE